MTKETILQIPVIVEPFRPLVNKSVRLAFTTIEGFDTQLLARFLSLNGEHGWLAFLPSNSNLPAIEAKDINLDSALPEPNKQSLSQQLRNQMWHYWITKNPEGTDKEFEQWRAGAMGQLIDKYRQAAWELKECVDNADELGQ